MSTITTSPTLRLGLLMDAVGSIAMGACLLPFAERLQGLFSIDQLQLSIVGAICVGYGSAVGWLATRNRLPEILVGSVVIGNSLWVLASLLLLGLDIVRPSEAGIAFVLAQAAAVLVFVIVQANGWRQSRQRGLTPAMQPR